jgi:hypothetical protein
MNSLPLPGSTRTALKEWAVACEALGQGQQMLLLRKGGIREEGRNFTVDHHEFLLFPTYEHQRTELLKPAAQDQLQRVLQARGSPDEVTLRYWAAVEQIFPVSELAALKRLAEHHLWSESYVEERLRWKPTQPLQVLVLRVYVLPSPITLVNGPEYGGCRSWLTLERERSLEGSRPALEAAEFGARLDQIRRALDRSPVEVSEA